MSATVRHRLLVDCATLAEGKQRRSTTARIECATAARASCSQRRPDRRGPLFPPHWERAPRLLQPSLPTRAPSRQHRLMQQHGRRHAHATVRCDLQATLNFLFNDRRGVENQPQKTVSRCACSDRTTPTVAMTLRMHVQSTEEGWGRWIRGWGGGRKRRNGSGTIATRLCSDSSRRSSRQTDTRRPHSPRRPAQTALVHSHCSLASPPAPPSPLDSTPLAVRSPTRSLIDSATRSSPSAALSQLRCRTDLSPTPRPPLQP